MLIETRGEGGYTIVAPSNGLVHPSGKPYVLRSGGVDTIATITSQERAALFTLARTFDAMPPKAQQKRTIHKPPGGRPGDDFAARSIWPDILEPAGWTPVYERGGITYWRRAGKEWGVSATTNYADTDLLYIFTTSTEFEADRGYGKFAAYAILNHNGDFGAAAKALAARGYGATPGGVTGSTGPYAATEHGIVWLKPSADGGTPVPLTNFSARIVSDLVRDDGVETVRELELEAVLRGRTSRFSVTAQQFSAMNWAVEQIGPTAIVEPGFGTRDRARAAVQALSNDVESRRVYTHVGWRQIEKRWCYLHAGGAIGPIGPEPAVEVHLEGALANYHLPPPLVGQDLVAGIHEDLEALAVAPDPITIPLRAATLRAVLGPADFSLHLSGPTGAGKTELAALEQQRFGPKMDGRHLPGGWASTANALEILAFGAKDAVFVVDDFAPAGSRYDVQRQHREADRLLRG